jgi:hypothetical protein
MVGESAVAESTMGKKSPTSELGTYNLITGDHRSTGTCELYNIAALPSDYTCDKYYRPCYLYFYSDTKINLSWNLRKLF